VFSRRSRSPPRSCCSRPLAQFIPRSALAGLLLLAAFRLVDWEQLLFHLRATRFDAGVVIATALAAVLISVEFCIIIGVFLSFVLYMPRAAQVRMVEFTRVTPQGFRERQPGDPFAIDCMLMPWKEICFLASSPSWKNTLPSSIRARRVTCEWLSCFEAGAEPRCGCYWATQGAAPSLRHRDVALLLGAVQNDLGKALAATGLDAQIGPRKHPFRSRRAMARQPATPLPSVTTSSTAASVPAVRDAKRTQGLHVTSRSCMRFSSAIRPTDEDHDLSQPEPCGTISL